MSQSSAERQRKFKANQLAAGKKRVCFYLKPDHEQRVRELIKLLEESLKGSSHK